MQSMCSRLCCMLRRLRSQGFRSFHLWHRSAHSERRQSETACGQWSWLRPKTIAWSEDCKFAKCSTRLHPLRPRPRRFCRRYRLQLQASRLRSVRGFPRSKHCWSHCRFGCSKYLLSLRSRLVCRLVRCCLLRFPVLWSEWGDSQAMTSYLS